MRYSNNPERYLGLPNIIGCNKKASFMGLKEQMKKRIDGWCMKFLSLGEKEVFVKSFKQYRHMQCLAFFFQELFVMIWRD